MSSNVKVFNTSSSHFCVLLIVCCVASFMVKIFLLNWSNIFHRFLYDVFVVADKSNVICILLVNFIVSYFVLVLFYAVNVVMKALSRC